MKTAFRIRGIVSMAALLAGGHVFAADAGQTSGFEFDGYFRVGPGATKKDAARACYNLGITGGHYRLGNECDFFGEFGLSHTGTLDGVTYKAKVMFAEWNPGTDIGGSNSNFEQMYVEGSGFDISGGTNFWVGKRFYGRSIVHILDGFPVRMDGVGAGADNIAVGGGKLGIAYFKADTGIGFNDPGTSTSTNPGNRINVDLKELPVNPGGKLRVTGTFTQGHFDNAVDGKGTNGLGLSLEHTQAFGDLGGTTNTVWLQFAKGSAGLNGNFGTMTAPSDVKKWLLMDAVTWQAGPWGGQAVALVGHHDRDDVNGIAEYKELSVGGRVTYALTKNFKLVGEVGHMEKRPNGAPKQQLTKFTFAPTLSTGPGFWNRPELRFYVTTARWNAAANDAAGRGGLTGLGDGNTRGTSYGMQAEIWF